MKQDIEEFLTKFAVIESYEESNLSPNLYQVEINDQEKGLFFREKLAQLTNYTVVDKSTNKPNYWIQER